MALYRIDGWDYWKMSSGTVDTDVQANAYADGYYDDVAQVSTNTGRFGIGQSMVYRNELFSSPVGEAIGRRWTTETTVIGQAMFTPHAFGANWTYGVVDAQGANGTQFWLQFDDLGVIRLYRGGTNSTTSGGGSVVATTPAKVYHADEWDYVEIKFLVHPTAGLVEVRVNTVVVMSYVGPTQNMMPPILGQAPGWDAISVGRTIGSAGPAVRLDDRYILDDTGTDNVDYLGNVRVNTQLTIAPGDVTQMSVFGAAANWNAVNEPELTEVEYVYDATMGDYDLYTMDPNVVAQNIFGVQVVGAHRQDDSTQLKSNLLLKTGGTEFAGADHFLAQTYHYYRDMWDLNPDTGVGWTAAELNAIQAGQKVLLG